MEVIALAVPADDDVHEAGGVLGGAGAQAVETQGVFVVVAAVVVIFSAGVQLAEDQLPVVLADFFVPVHRAAPAEVLDLDAAIPEVGDDDLLAEALAGLVDGVGEDLKDGVLAALQPVGAKNNAGPFPDPIRALQTGDAFVVVSVFLCHIIPPAYTEPFVFLYSTVFSASMQASPDNKRGTSAKKRSFPERFTGLHKK